MNPKNAPTKNNANKLQIVSVRCKYNYSNLCSWWQAFGFNVVDKFMPMRCIEHRIIIGQRSSTCGHTIFFTLNLASWYSFFMLKWVFV